MNKGDPGRDLDNLLKEALKDDLAPELEARMHRRLLDLKRSLERGADVAASAPRWLWARWEFQKQTLAFVSVVLLALGGVMHLRGAQSVLANSIERFKVIGAVSDSLNQVTSMDCTMRILDDEKPTSFYRLRWSAGAGTRVDMDSADGTRQTVWIKERAKAPNPIWQPAMEFLTPFELARNMEARYRLMTTMRQDGAESGEFLLVGSEDLQGIEIAVDDRTYLPKTLKTYSQDSRQRNREGKCLIEARFKWDQPISRDLLIPGFHDAQ